MRFKLVMKIVVLASLTVCAMNAIAQVVVANDGKATSATAAPQTLEVTESKTSKPMVKDATISLQTTITGNQEQPKVLYILPWQSPQATDVDFEPLDNLQKAVFSHVERDELRRELETTDAIKD